MKKFLILGVAIVFVAALHETMHALPAVAYAEYDAFRVRPFGLEVLFNTPVAVRQGIQWAVISGLPNLATVAFGYMLLVGRGMLISQRFRGIRDLGYWLTLICLIADPINLSVGPLIYGGDALGIAVGLGTSTAVIQGVAFLVLLVNRELVVQVLLPAYGVVTTHFLFQPLIRPRRSSPAA
jgi:hypothetical protein